MEGILKYDFKVVREDEAEVYLGNYNTNDGEDCYRYRSVELALYGEASLTCKSRNLVNCGRVS